MVQTEFVGVDWGTSSFRAWHCSPTRHPRLLERSKKGMSKLNRSDFEPYLEKVLREGQVPETVPVLICGMAGARGAWHEAPYANAPAGQDDIAEGAVRVRAGRYSCIILPGVCFSSDGHFDVMRGEETLLSGAISRGSGDGLYCLPGTHSKWCRIEGGKLKDWQTVMTGELFALLSNQSTLSDFCSSVSENLHEKPEFTDAVSEVLNGESSAMLGLFPIRARGLLDPKAGAYDFSARLSGLLIGDEIAGLMSDDISEVTLISMGSVSCTYRKALELAGIKVNALDSAESVLAGLGVFAQQLFPEFGPAENTG